MPIHIRITEDGKKRKTVDSPSCSGDSKPFPQSPSLPNLFSKLEVQPSEERKTEIRRCVTNECDGVPPKPVTSVQFFKHWKLLMRADDHQTCALYLKVCIK